MYISKSKNAKELGAAAAKLTAQKLNEAIAKQGSAHHSFDGSFAV